MLRTVDNCWRLRCGCKFLAGLPAAASSGQAWACPKRFCCFVIQGKKLDFHIFPPYTRSYGTLIAPPGGSTLLYIGGRPGDPVTFSTPKNWKSTCKNIIFIQGTDGTIPAESTVYELDLGLASAWAERTDLALPTPSLWHGAVAYWSDISSWAWIYRVLV